MFERLKKTTANKFLIPNLQENYSEHSPNFSGEIFKTPLQSSTPIKVHSVPLIKVILTS